MASVRQLKEPSKKTGKRPWVVEYTDRDGKRKRATPKSGLKRDAEALRLKIEVEIEHGTHIARVDALTVDQLAEKYIRYIEEKRDDGRVGRTHYDQQRMGINRSILPHLRGRLVTSLDAETINDWYRGMVTKDGLSPTTARTRVNLLRSIEAFANKRGYMKLTPVKDVAIEFRGIKAKPIRTMNSDQVAKLLALVSEELPFGDARMGEMLACYVHLAAFCGLRFGEIGGLTLANLRLHQGILQVRHNLTHYDEHKTPKTAAGVRDIHLPVHLSDMLRAWVARRYIANDRDLVFRIKGGGMYSPGNFHNRMWKPVLKLAGITGPDWPHFHALRHFAASWMIQNHMPVTEVAAVMGHAHFDMTLQVYAHPIAGGARRREAMDQMSASLLQLADMRPDAHAT